MLCTLSLALKIKDGPFTYPPMTVICKIILLFFFFKPLIFSLFNDRSLSEEIICTRDTVLLLYNYFNIKLSVDL